MTPEEKIKNLISRWDATYKFNEKMIDEAPGMEPMLRGSQAMLFACIAELRELL